MHSFVSCLMHCVFSTKERRRLITPQLAERLYPYLGGIARENKMRALSIGGVEDHVHALISIPSTLSIAKAIQLLKGNSSKWIHATFPEHRLFEWQEGYGAFSIAVSGLEDTIRYIQSQKEHHRIHSFKDELIAFLEKHGIAYGELDARLIVCRPCGTFSLMSTRPSTEALGYFRSSLRDSTSKLSSKIGSTAATTDQ